MTHPPALLPLLALLAALGPAFAQEKKPDASAPDRQVRQAAGRGLAFLEKEGLAWLDNRKCIACHHVPFLIWSHREARGRGIASADVKKLDAWAARALDLYLAGRKDHEKKKTGAVEATNLLLGIGGGPGGRLTDVRALLLNAQRADGSWKYEGQGIRRPDAESDEAATLWALLALSAAGDDPAAARARERGVAWVKKQPTGEGNEAFALRLLLAARLGDAEGVKARTQDLLARQNPDGGWSWTKGAAGGSDAFATGQSLYALASAGLPADDPAVRRGVQLLLQKQRPDGSWFSPTRKPNAKDNPIAVYWGTAWATLGLTRTLPPAKGS